MEARPDCAEHMEFDTQLSIYRCKYLRICTLEVMHGARRRQIFCHDDMPLIFKPSDHSLHSQSDNVTKQVVVDWSSERVVHQTRRTASEVGDHWVRAVVLWPVLRGQRCVDHVRVKVVDEADIVGVDCNGWVCVDEQIVEQVCKITAVQSSKGLEALEVGGKV